MIAETTTPETTPEPETPERTEIPVLSITEHAKAHDSAAQQEPNEKPNPANQKRDESGQFQKGRHRAESQKASAADAPRINALTGRAKSAEERAEKAERELATLKAQHAPPAQIARAEARVEQAQPVPVTDPEPQETDAKYAGDYGKYLRDVARWDNREQTRADKAAAQAATDKAEKDKSARATLESWSKRVKDAQGKYADFDAVAINGPSLIPEGSYVDAWIMEHKGGADVLYYLHQADHRQELESLLSMPLIEQVDALALLTQRLLSPTSSQAGSTGAAAGRPIQVVLPHRPPTPVRTEAQRTRDEPAPTDGTLGIRAHNKQWGRRT